MQALSPYSASFKGKASRDFPFLWHFCPVAKLQFARKNADFCNKKLARSNSIWRRAPVTICEMWTVPYYLCSIPGNLNPGNWDPGNWDPGNWDPVNWDPSNWDPGNWDPSNWESVCCLLYTSKVSCWFFLPLVSFFHGNLFLRWFPSQTKNQAYLK